MTRTAALVLLLSSVAAAQAPAPPITEDQLIGTWVAVHRSLGGLGSIWEFQRGGKLQVSFGAVVEEPYKVAGDRLIMPPGSSSPGARPMVIKFRIADDFMYWSSPELGGKEARFKRTGQPPAGDPPIVGEWLMDTPATEPSTPEGKVLDEKSQEAITHVARMAIHEYTRDGLAKLRVPMRTQDGSYDVKDQTFIVQVPGPGGPQQKPGRFRMQDGLLVLTQPDGKTEDTYIRSTATKEELKRAGVSYGGKPADLDRDPEHWNP